MRYLQQSFTLPASNNISQLQWDLIFMTRDEFKIAYGITDKEYDFYIKETCGRSLS